LDEINFDSNIGFMEEENNRSVRFMELIEEYPKLSYEDFKRIKYDIQYPDSLIGMFQLNDVFNINATDYPKMEELILLVQNWDRRADIDNIGAAQWSIYYKTLLTKAKEYNLYGKERLADSIIIEALNITQNHLLKYFGKLDITLAEQQLHVRGGTEMPIPGLVDMIAAMSTEPYRDGKVKAVSGESYIMLARYSNEGVELETILPYGESSNPKSEYFTNQMQRFVEQELKPMTLDKETIYKNAVQIYHPLKK
ncbi:MAG: penicillin acylase family protein, partial [Crocinitomicaceae bacterium]